MDEKSASESLLEAILRGTPDRLVDAVALASGAGPETLPWVRDALALTALAAPPAVPPPGLRARILGARPRPLRPKRPVVVVLDMIQDHLTPGRVMEVPRARDIVPALQARLADARARSVPILYVCDSHPADDAEFGEWPAHAVEGTPGADVIPQLAPAPGDRILRKRTYSAFTGSTLASELDALGADEIILTGCATEVGMMATATDALQRGYVVTMPPDTQAGASALGEQVSLLVLSTMPPFDARYLRHRAG